MTVPRTLTWTVSLVLLGVLALGLSRSSALQPVRNISTWVFNPFESAVHAVFAPIGDFASNVGGFGALKKDNRDLRDENERLNNQLSQLRETQSQAVQNDELQKSAQLFPDADFSLASVIARDPSNVHDAVLINKGRNANIQNGMIIVGKGGALLGTVSQTLATSAWVRLITDPDSDVNAAVQETRAMAIVSGELGQKLQLQFVAEGTDVKPGDTVITSGLGGNYPKGLLIGKVSKVAGAPSDLFKQIEVEPAVHPGTLESVLVMTSFVPSRAGAGQ